MEDMECLGSLPNASNKDCEGNQRKRRLLGQKLSLKSERSEKNTKTENQDPVASHLLFMASSTYPTAFIPDVSSKQNAKSENMCINASSGVVPKKESEGNRKNLHLPGKRLSIASVCQGNNMLPNHPPASVSNSRDCVMQSSDDVAVAENSLARSIGGSSDSLNKPLERNRRIIRTLGLKLSLKSLKPEKKTDDQKENMVPNHLPSHSSFNNLQKRPLEDVSIKNFSEAATLIPLNSGAKNKEPNSQLLSNNNCNQGRKKPCLLSKRLSLKSKLPETDRTCDQESKLPAYAQSGDRKQPNELPLSAPVLKTEAMAPTELPLPVPAFKSHQNMALGSAGPQEDVNPSNRSIKQSAAVAEKMVVADSEDSADECERPSRLRMSLMRRRLAGKVRN
jgi:ubiquitin-conjugating enzyme E2 T